MIFSPASLDAGADPNLADNNGNSALAWSLLKFFKKDAATGERGVILNSYGFKNQFKIVDSLLKAGSRVNQKDKLGETPMGLIDKLAEMNIQGIDNAKMEALRNLREDSLESALAKARLTEMIQSPGDATFQEIIRFLQLNASKMQDLLNTKFRIHWSGEDHTLLELALIKGDLQAVNRLLQMQAKPDINLVTTALEFAMRRRENIYEQDRYLEIAKILIENGAPFTAEDKEILENIIPQREDILILMGGEPGNHAELTEAQVKAAREKLLESTGLSFDIIKTAAGFQLQHASTLSGYDYDSRPENIKQAFGKDLCLIQTCVSRGMGFGTLTLVIPPQIILMILTGNFDALEKIQKKQETIRRAILLKNANTAVPEEMPPLSQEAMYRSKKDAEQLLERLNRFTGKGWEAVETGEGWILLYKMPSDSMQILRNSGVLESVNNILGMTLHVNPQHAFPAYIPHIPELRMGCGLILEADRIQHLLETRENTLNNNLQREMLRIWNQKNQPSSLLISTLVRLKPEWINKPLACEDHPSPLMCVANDFSEKWRNISAAVERTESLLKLGADIHQKDAKGRTALDYATKRAVQNLRTNTTKPDIMMLLLQKGAQFSPNFHNTKNKILDMVVASLIANLPYDTTDAFLFNLLLKEGARLSQTFINTKNKGKTPLEAVFDKALAASGKLKAAQENWHEKRSIAEAVSATDTVTHSEASRKANQAYESFIHEEKPFLLYKKLFDLLLSNAAVLNPGQKNLLERNNFWDLIKAPELPATQQTAREPGSFGLQF